MRRTAPCGNLLYRGAADSAWPRYRLIGVVELAAAGILIGLWWHPLGLAAAAGMAVLLIGALITHRRALDSAKEMAPALLALAITIAYLVVALTG